jgi:methyl coenzyme M reductase alpha subunit
MQVQQCHQQQVVVVLVQAMAVIEQVLVVVTLVYLKVQYQEQIQSSLPAVAVVQVHMTALEKMSQVAAVVAPQV